MSEPETITAVTDAVAVASPAEGPAEGDAKARFSKALDEARAGAVALGKDVQGKAGAYADRLGAKGHDLLDDAKALTEEAKDRAATLADEGKVRASEALVSLGKLVEEN
ncbi:MAG TPA: hypothetical protein VFF94_11165, partial [Novosphingobium sp.]|nr:hypothetical protein [Novosphingobium sp.]